MFKIFRRHDVVVFIAVRQDVLRWALSKLHGDGTGRPGHLQFRLSRGRIRREDIPALAVDCDALDRVIGECESMHRDKAQLLDELRATGISAHPVLYERFCDDPLAFFAEMLEHIEKHADPAEISAVLERGTEFQKVHSPDIADFVVNHEEVLERFSTRFVAWD
jgi:LPS sulfotransferase NodH